MGQTSGNQKGQTDDRWTKGWAVGRIVVGAIVLGASFFPNPAEVSKILPDLLIGVLRLTALGSIVWGVIDLLQFPRPEGTTRTGPRLPRSSQSNTVGLQGLCGAALVTLALLLVSVGKYAWAQEAFAVGLLGSLLLLLAGSVEWVRRVDEHSLLNAGEKVQYKDAVVIGGVFLAVLAVGFYAVAAGATGKFGFDAGRIFLGVKWGLAATAAGGILGFLFGLPKVDQSSAASNARPSGFRLKANTSLDEITDWLTKSLVGLGLFEAQRGIQKIGEWANDLSRGFGAPEAGDRFAYSFIIALFVFFPLVGFVGVYLVTRTYLAGALSRADRVTLGAFENAGLLPGELEILEQTGAALGSRDDVLPEGAKQIAAKLAQLGLDDLRSRRELLLWSKAKSTAKQHLLAIIGFQKALAQCASDPELHLAYAVALKQAFKDKVPELKDALFRMRSELQLAYRCLSAETPEVVRRNVFKSLTYDALYQPAPGGFEFAIAKSLEYLAEAKSPVSGGVMVNLVCAYGQKARWLKGLIAAANEPAPATGSISDSETLKKFKEQGEAEWAAKLADVRKEALKWIQKILERDPSWTQRLRDLLAGKRKWENDLVAFQDDPNIRTAIGLPPVGSIPDEMLSQTPAQTDEDDERPASDVGQDAKEGRKAENAADPKSENTDQQKENPESGDTETGTGRG